MLKILLLTALAVSAHDGGHDSPGAVEAQKGGIVRPLETVTLELVTEGDKILIYAFDPKDKSAKPDVSKYPVTATVSLRNKKTETLTIMPKGDHWESEFKAPKGEHRYTLLLDIKQGGHSDKIKWTVEPKRKMANE